MHTPGLNLERLFKLRIVVARFGEMDRAGWWNTKGQLGPVGAVALKRGFPRTSRFAAARSVFAVAAHRCEEVFNPPKCVTLWRLTADIEEEFDARWEQWIDAPTDLNDFIDNISGNANGDLSALLRDLNLVHDNDLGAFEKLKRSADGRAVALPGVFDATDANITRLALGFAKGSQGALTVPYARLAE